MRVLSPLPLSTSFSCRHSPSPLTDLLLPSRLGVEFLTATGQISNDKRTEFILLSDILGLSCLVDSMNHPVVPPATEGTVLGPFHTDDPLVVRLLPRLALLPLRKLTLPLPSQIKPGESIASEGKGEFMWCEGYIRGLDGKPLAGVVIESWETDDDGLYVFPSPLRLIDMLTASRTSMQVRCPIRGSYRGGLQG